MLTPNFFWKVYKHALFLLIPSCLTLMGIGLSQALIISPADFQQDELVRIMYIHVPAAWLSLSIYLFMAVCSFINLVSKNRFCYIAAGAGAPVGASFAFITLITGSIWGYPTWGAWWVWDGRLTSMLILFLFYLAYIALFDSKSLLAEKPCSVISLIGAINVPIVKFSVKLWATLHQGQSIYVFSASKIDVSMLKPLFFMFGAFASLAAILIIMRICYLLASIRQRIQI